MNLSRREFSSVMAAALAAGFPMRHEAHAAQAASLYNVPRSGNVHLLHMTDCHAQLLPIHFREPSVNLGLGAMQGRLPHLVGEHLLKAAHLKAGTPEAHAFTYLNFERAARQYGKVGGFAHLATLVKQLKAGRPGASGAPGDSRRRRRSGAPSGRRARRAGAGFPRRAGPA